MENLTINNAVYEPKLNFKFYRQTRDDKELQDGRQDGFSALIGALLDEDVDAIVAAYYHALAWYRRNQPSESDVEEALESTVFVSDEATDKAFDDILDALQANDFLARKLRQYVKDSDKNADMVQKQIDQTKDEDKASNLAIGLKQLTAETNKLRNLLKSDESSPKPDDADSHQQN